MILLVAILAVPLVGALVAALAGRVSDNTARGSALTAMFTGLGLALTLVTQVASGPVAFVTPWIPSLGVSFHVEADGLSAVLILLAAVIGVVAVLVSWDEIKERVAAFHFWMLLLQAGILLVFLARDFLLFFFGWEMMLIPMFFLIGVWGTRGEGVTPP